MGKKKERETTIGTRAIRFANEYVPGPPDKNMARFVGKFYYNLEKSESSKKKDACEINKKIIPYPTVEWFQEPGSADVLGIDAPGTHVKAHNRITKSGKLTRVKGYYKKSKKFPGHCK